MKVPAGACIPVEVGPGLSEEPNPHSDRTRASPPIGPETRRRANPGIRLSFTPVRLRAAQGPIRAGARRRADPGRRAERTRDPAPSEPERTPFVRRGAAPCGTGPGMPDTGPPATGLSKTILHYRDSGPARSPNPRRGTEPPPAPVGSGPGGRASNGPTTTPEPRSSTEQSSLVLTKRCSVEDHGRPIRQSHESRVACRSRVVDEPEINHEPVARHLRQPDQSAWRPPARPGRKSGGTRRGHGPPDRRGDRGSLRA